MSFKGKGVTFILPGPSKHPVGGYKVVYEYANRLSRRGYRVTLIHPAIVNDKLSLAALLRRYTVFIVRYITNTALPKWFSLDKEVRLQWTLSAAESHLPDADYVFGTAWQTAHWVEGYSRSKGTKFYLIQGLETWSDQEADVFETWRYNLHKIAVSKWLQQAIQSVGETAAYIPNGLDFEGFGRDTSMENRFSHSVMMLYHQDPHKGSADGLAALERLRKDYPELKARAFGVSSRPSHFPSWIEYYSQPTPKKLRELYNSTAVFIAPSHTEGWGLTGCEALQCGAALVATNISGHREYAIDGETALLCEPRHPNELAQKVAVLFEDKTQRERLADNGHNFVQRFNWESSVNALEQAMLRSADLKQD